MPKLFPAPNPLQATKQKVMNDSEIKHRLKNRAMWALARREYSQKELAQVLSVYAKRHAIAVSNEQIISIITDLQEIDLQSDIRFASSFVRMRSNHKIKSIKHTLQELRQKGVDETLLSNLNNDQLSDEERINLLLTPYKIANKTPKQLLDFLLRRGFDYALCKNVLAKLGIFLIK